MPPSQNSTSARNPDDPIPPHLRPTLLSFLTTPTSIRPALETIKLSTSTISQRLFHQMTPEQQRATSAANHAVCQYIKALAHTKGAELRVEEGEEELEAKEEEVRLMEEELRRMKEALRVKESELSYMREEVGEMRGALGESKMEEERARIGAREKNGVMERVFREA